MPDYIPPTEAELEECLDVVGTATSYDYGEVRLSPEVTRSLIREIRRLRELCRRAAKHGWLQDAAANHAMRDELCAASKGEVWIAK